MTILFNEDLLGIYKFGRSLEVVLPDDGVDWHASIKAFANKALEYPVSQYENGPFTRETDTGIMPQVYRFISEILLNEVDQGEIKFYTSPVYFDYDALKENTPDIYDNIVRNGDLGQYYPYIVVLDESDFDLIESNRQHEKDVYAVIVGSIVNANNIGSMDFYVAIINLTKMYDYTETKPNPENGETAIMYYPTIWNAPAGRWESPYVEEVYTCSAYFQDHDKLEDTSAE